MLNGILQTATDITGNSVVMSPLMTEACTSGRFADLVLSHCWILIQRLI